MASLKELYTPRKSVFDKSRRDVVLDITDLTEGKVDPKNFFSENYITEGMKHLYQAVFKRLEGKSDDGIFKLTQSMGGGKTHNMVAIGLLAKYPEFREKVMSKVYQTSFSGEAKVIGFTGRENPKYGIWGHLAEQLGKRELFRDYYDPLEAPGQSAWINLLKGEKVIIMLDELPPYFEAAKAKQIGNSDLAVVTTQALSNLLVAIGKEELKNVVLIISDLRANYEGGSAMIGQVLDNYSSEINRSAKNFTPVQQGGDEIYNILRTKLFENEAPKEAIDKIAEAYAAAIKEARQMEITTETPERFATAVRDAFPFHPGIKDLYARFKENPGFMQTRGLIRFMRTIVARMWNEEDGWADKVSLISPHDIDLHDDDTLTEIAGINTKLTNAISHDIAGNPQAVAESLDDHFGNDLATKTAKLILMSSLATVQNSIRGLKDTEIIRNLAAPGVNISEIQSKILPELKSNCWYLHLDNSGNFLFKNVQNVVAKLRDYVSGYTDEGIVPDIQNKLIELFNPIDKDCYQKVYALPSLDQIELDIEKVSLIIYKPNSGGLHPDLQRLYDDATYKNRILFLTGDAHSMEVIYQNVKALRGIESIIKEFDSEKVPKNDPQYIEAEKLSENFLFKFRSAVTSSFVKLYYPTKRGLLDANFQMKFSGNNYNGERQIAETLAEKRKFTEDITGETFVRYVESKLFGNQKSLPWKDIKSKAAQTPDWIWHKPDALDQLKEEMLRKDLWRANNTWIEKGPFPPPKTSVTIREISRNDETGEVSLKIIPTHGDTIHYEFGDSKVTTASNTFDYHDKTFDTSELKVSFLCVDTKGKHETGTPALYQNRITIKHFFHFNGEERTLEIKAAPHATIKYSTDGSDPFTAGGVYEELITIPDSVNIVVVGAERQGIYSEVKTLRVPEKEASRAEIDRTLSAIWENRIQHQSTAEVFKWLPLLEKHHIKLSGMALAIKKSNAEGNGDDWIAIDSNAKLIFELEQISKMLTNLQELLKDGELTLEAEKLHFPTGQKLYDYARDTHEEIKNEDVEQ